MKSEFHNKEVTSKKRSNWNYVQYDEMCVCKCLNLCSIEKYSLRLLCLITHHFLHLTNDIALILDVLNIFF